MEIYHAKDKQLNATEDFWQLECGPSDQEILFGSNLVHQGADGTLQSDYYMLTANNFVKCRGMTTSLHKKTIVNWKLVEFFSDEGDFHLSGFRLSYVKGTETFYTQTFADQKNWVLWLSKLCLTNYLNTSFRVLEIIGEGVHSEVRKAVRIDTNETFAIKYVLKKSHAIDPCMKEIDLLRRLNHESIVKLYGVFDTAEYLAVVLEYAEGGSLYEYMQSHKRLEEDLARQFMINLLQAIAYLHNNKCVHRNLKLENILLMDRDNPLSFKVADFGLACDLSSEKLGTRCGSVGYIAPEIILKRPQSNKVDLFSAGVIMHCCCLDLLHFWDPRSYYF
mmetsp:Transcript_14612/g.27132  ORF Transcript_14612/g.27132 Transcript_14612/m.27132 type:complete len:334 (+) Transcript_14612:549-1550(+)